MDTGDPTRDGLPRKPRVVQPEISALHKTRAEGEKKQESANNDDGCMGSHCNAAPCFLEK